MMTLLEIWAIMGPALAAGLVWLLRPKTYIGLHSDPTAHTPEGEVDELLRWDDGAQGFLPLVPPKFVLGGKNPVHECWALYHAEGVRYDSRRVPAPKAVPGGARRV